MQIVDIRTDASSAIGTGHVIRCLGLADALRRRGAVCRFVCAEAPGHLADLIAARGFEVDAIPPGLAPGDDVAATRARLARSAPADWLIVDHYHLDAAWERAAQKGGAGPMAHRILAIDDLADRPHDVDLLLDSAHPADEAWRYDALLNAEAVRLIGQEYVMLRTEFSERAAPDREPDRFERLLVTLGGNDPLDVTSLALDALADPRLAGLQADVTVGTSNPRLEALRARVADDPRITLHVQHPRPSDLMAAADLCFGAGGQTSWERCFMGLPSVVAILAENQVQLTDRVARMALARNLGWATALTPRALADALIEAGGDVAWRRSAEAAGRALIDGRGLARVVDAIEAAR